MHIWHTAAHKKLLIQIMKKHKIDEPFCSSDETAFTLYNQALAEMERCSCPRLGIATDRRAMLHLGEVFTESNISSVMCFICGCKHIKHEGFDKLGRRVQKGSIEYRGDKRALLRRVLSHSAYADSWKHNLSHKYFKNRFGDAVATDPDLQEGVFEWRRKVQRQGIWEEAICCPEDVHASPKCKHDETVVCSMCDIPICNECWTSAINNEKIPKALACDNFIGYAHPFLVDSKATWLEATIAAPVFSGLITYYVEGHVSNRYNLMDSTLGKAERSWGVRGNLFSFQLPWEQVLQQLYEKVEDGDLSDWPLHPSTARNLVRVRFIKGPADLLQEFRDLYVRSAVVKKLAEIYIDRKYRIWQAGHE